jgi:acetyl-CoA carboxylase alpha subunit
LDHGQIDLVLDVSNASETPATSVQEKVEALVGQIASALIHGCQPFDAVAVTKIAESLASESDKQQAFNYTRSRQIDRPQTQDIIANLFDSFVELR